MALAELVHRWRMPAWTCVRRTLDAERAYDVTQEAWLAVVRALPRLRETDRFEQWLLTIARRSVTDCLRAEHARAAAVAVDEPAPDDVFDTVVERARRVAALASLPVLERQVLALSY